jgi:hypothetical protein
MQPAPAACHWHAMPATRHSHKPTAAPAPPTNHNILQHWHPQTSGSDQPANLLLAQAAQETPAEETPGARMHACMHGGLHKHRSLRRVCTHMDRARNPCQQQVQLPTSIQQRATQDIRRTLLIRLKKVQAWLLLLLLLLLVGRAIHRTQDRCKTRQESTYYTTNILHKRYTYSPAGRPF